MRREFTRVEHKRTIKAQELLWSMIVDGAPFKSDISARALEMLQEMQCTYSFKPLRMPMLEHRSLACHAGRRLRLGRYHALELR